MLNHCRPMPGSLGMSDKPDVSDISGLSPAISIRTEGRQSQSRSTVGTITEIYDYLRLLFGEQALLTAPSCGKRSIVGVKRR